MHSDETMVNVPTVRARPARPAPGVGSAPRVWSAPGLVPLAMAREAEDGNNKNRREPAQFNGLGSGP